MADKPLNRLYFAVTDVENPPNKSATTKLSYFSCRASVARFLDIESKASSAFITFKRKGGERKKKLADGTTLGGAATSVSDAQVAKAISSKGSKTVVLQTGNVSSENPTTKAKVYNTISFRFPGSFKISEINDALASIIPSTKIKATRTAGNVTPYFKVLGGGTYPLVTQAAATANPDVKTDKEAEAQIVSSGGTSTESQAKPA